MGSADLDFWERELLVIDRAPHLFFGGIAALIVPLGLLIWFLVNWAYQHRFAAKDDQLTARDAQLAARDERLTHANEQVTHAKENQQDAERKSKDLQLVIERLEAQLQALAGIEDITVTVSSAKTKADELVIASNAVSSAIETVVGTLAATEMSDWFTNTPLALQTEADKERAK